MSLPDDYRFAHWVPDSIKELVQGLARPNMEYWSAATHRITMLTRASTSIDLNKAFKTVLDRLKKQGKDAGDSRLDDFLQAVAEIPVPEPGKAPALPASALVEEFGQLVRELNTLAHKLEHACSRSSPPCILTDPKLTSVLSIGDSAIGDITLFDALRAYASQLQREIDCRKPVRGQNLQTPAALAWTGPPLSADEGTSAELDDYARRIRTCAHEHLGEHNHTLVAAIVSAMSGVPFSKQRVQIFYL